MDEGVCPNLVVMKEDVGLIIPNSGLVVLIGQKLHGHELMVILKPQESNPLKPCCKALQRPSRLFPSKNSTSVGFSVIVITETVARVAGITSSR